MHIIKATDAMAVEHPVFLIFGQPGIGKTSLAYSAADPLVLDFDQGAHRAAGRRDTLAIGTWADVEDLMNHPDALAPYTTIVPDTVGRCLDVLTSDIIRESPKLGPNGNLSQAGWGVLKTRFRTWVSRLRALGKDVILIAHDKEERDGDTRIVRPDIVGGSYNEVMKVADFVGYLYMSGKDRILDLSPTDKWIGKNPAAWPPFKLPPVSKAQTFLAERMDEGRAALGAISDTSAEVTRQVEEWRTTITGFTTAEQFNAAIPQVKALSPILAPQVSKLLLDLALTKGVLFDKAKKRFVEPAQPEQPALAGRLP